MTLTETLTSKNWNVGSGDFNNPDNWNPIGVPASSDDTTFSFQSSPYTVTGNGTVADLTVNDNITITGTLGVSGNATVEKAAQSNSFLDQAGLTIASDASLSVGGTLTLGPQEGNLTINGSLDDASSTIGPPGFDFPGGPSIITLSGPGATWTNNGTVILGANCSLAIENGATFSSTNLFVTGSQIALDPNSYLLGPVFIDHLLAAIAPTGTQTGSTAVVSGPLTVDTSNFAVLESAAGIALNIQGSISDTSNEAPFRPLIVEGTVILSNPDNTYSDGTVLFTSAYVGNNAPPDISVNTLVLAATGAGGGGPVYLSAAHSVLDVEPDSSAAADGSTTAIGGSGADTISAVNSPVLAYGGSGSLNFYNGTAASTLIGGSGSLLAFSGSGGGLLAGSTNGNGVLLAGAGKTTILGGGNGDQLYADANGGDLLAAGAGNETLTSGQSGNNLIFGGSGADVIEASAGDLVVGTSGGLAVIGGGSGDVIFFAGSGPSSVTLSGSLNYVQFGVGSTTVASGSGASEFSVMNGASGSSNVITNFKHGIDQIALRDYGAAPSIISSNGSTIISLSDNTTITLPGVSSLSQNSFN